MAVPPPPGLVHNPSSFKAILSAAVATAATLCVMYNLAIPLVKMNIRSVNRLLSPRGDLFRFQVHLRGEGGRSIERGGLTNSEKKMVSVLHKELE